jgi:hypothetical protein
MGFFAKTFREISRPASIIKNTFTSRKKFYGELRDTIRNENKQVDSPPVSKNTSKAEFLKRYEHLHIHQCIIGVFMLYSFSYMLFSESILNFFTSAVIFVFFLVSYVTVSYKGFLCRLYFSSWENRFERINIPFKVYLNKVFNNLTLLLPEKDINNNNKNN